jgi:hypothetical protein
MKTMVMASQQCGIKALNPYVMMVLPLQRCDIYFAWHLPIFALLALAGSRKTKRAFFMVFMFIFFYSVISSL